MRGYAGMCREEKLASFIFLSHSLLYYLRQDLPLDLDLDLAICLTKPMDPPLSAFSMLGLKTHVHMSNPLHGCWASEFESSCVCSKHFSD